MSEALSPPRCVDGQCFAPVPEAEELDADAHTVALSTASATPLDATAVALRVYFLFPVAVGVLRPADAFLIRFGVAPLSVLATMSTPSPPSEAFAVSNARRNAPEPRAVRVGPKMPEDEQ